MADLAKQLAQKWFEIYSTDESKLSDFVSGIKTDHHEILPDILHNFSQLLSSKLNIDKVGVLKKLEKIVLAPKNERDLIKAIEQDINKNFMHLSATERRAMIDEQVAKFKSDKQKKKQKQQQKKANRAKTPEELLANFTANLEKQLAHKTPEERKIKMEAELKKYKDILNKRGKTIDELVEDEKEDISKHINEFLLKKYPDKTEEEKAILFKEHFDKNVKLCREGFEDTKIFNKRMEEKRRELEEIKYSNDVNGLDKMRKQLIEICIKQKKEFLGILDENDLKKANDPNTRTFERGKEPIVKSIPVDDASHDDMSGDGDASHDDMSGDNGDDAVLVDIEPNDIEPVVSDKEKRIRNKYKEFMPNDTVELAIRDQKYFEHSRTEYVYHDRLNQQNFTNKTYYYKVRKFYLENPEKLKPFVNLLFWEKAIDELELTEDDHKMIDTLITKEATKQAEQQEKKKQARVRAEAEKKEIAEIDEKLKNADQSLEDSTLSAAEYKKIVETLIARRDLLEPPVKTPEEQLQDYAIEMREKYSRIENIRIERQGIINMELSEYTKVLKREIAKERKLTNERKEKTQELTEQYKKRYGNREIYVGDRIKSEVDEYIKAREKELNTYFIAHGIDPKEHDDIAIKNSKIIAADYLKQKDTAMWKSMEPEMKQEYFKTKYPQFFDSFPIVVKFMIQQDKFEVVAFKKFLEKCRSNASAGANPYEQNMPKKGTKRLTPNEEKWLENQAFYVQYLVEEYRKSIGQRTSTAELNLIRNKQLEALRSEMMDFRSNFEKVAEKLKAEHNNNDEQLLKEYIDRIKSGEAELTIEEQENIAFAIEQIVLRKEEIKAKILETEKASQKELVDVEQSDETNEADYELIDEQPESEQFKSEQLESEQPKSEQSESKLKQTKPKPPKKPESKMSKAPLPKKSLKKRLMALKKKQSTLTESEQQEYLELKNQLTNSTQQAEQNEKVNKLDATIGCHCLEHSCAKCIVELKLDEANAFSAAKKNIKARDPKTWNIWETFIMKKPNKSTVLLEYAGGHLDPVSVRQFLNTGKFLINGDHLELVNKNKKYGGFFKSG